MRGIKDKMIEMKLSLLLGLLGIANAAGSGTVEPGRICVAIEENQTIAEVAGEGLTGCVSSREFTRPTIKQTSPHSWEVIGKFVRNSHDKPRTPDCGGAIARYPLGKLESGTYEIKSGARRLKFTLPAASARVCEP